MQWRISCDIISGFVFYVMSIPITVISISPAEGVSMRCSTVLSTILKCIILFRELWGKWYHDWNPALGCNLYRLGYEDIFKVYPSLLMPVPLLLVIGPNYMIYHIHTANYVTFNDTSLTLPSQHPHNLKLNQKNSINMYLFLYSPSPWLVTRGFT